MIKLGCLGCTTMSVPLALLLTFSVCIFSGCGGGGGAGSFGNGSGAKVLATYTADQTNGNGAVTIKNTDGPPAAWNYIPGKYSGTWDDTASPALSNHSGSGTFSFDVDVNGAVLNGVFTDGKTTENFTGGLNASGVINFTITYTDSSMTVSGQLTTDHTNHLSGDVKETADVIHYKGPGQINLSLWKSPSQ